MKIKQIGKLYELKHKGIKNAVPFYACKIEISNKALFPVLIIYINNKKIVHLSIPKHGDFLDKIKLFQQSYYYTYNTVPEFLQNELTELLNNNQSGYKIINDSEHWLMFECINND